ncbi:heavy-metal-associated domain-containing protein [Vicingaceae bacterium]|jgi:copper chaperone|nr:heavy-metal-associated domain-containing protein [Vicingaceae bacterium]
MKEIIEIDNLKCGGCGNTIRKNLLEINGVIEANAIPDDGTVEVEMSKDVMRAVIDKLSSLGYPPAGTTSNVQIIKSYASCVVGRIG